MRVLTFLLITLIVLINAVQSMRYDKEIYEALLDDLKREYVERELANRVLAKRQLRAINVDAGEQRVRRASEKKSYPRNCYFSPIQCLFTRN
ncbi:unnamed protein product [Caenorhabditis bovis]|uniref:Uncharacterized protein n=1 Tax=Caenorhabditis bovis TaxID=2654633 RepID=A0A8S1FD98_9PELO|nr:unnamed protein product [Caenorhabditis bovis]